MLFSRQRKFVFIHNQKTGGVSISHFLNALVTDLESLWPEHGYASDGIARLGREEWDRCYSFGFVRNPWARLASWYSMIVERPRIGAADLWWRYVRANSNGFEEFVLKCTDVIEERRGELCYRRSAVTNQLDYFTDADGRIATSFIGRYESLERDFGQVERALGLPVLPLPRSNPSAKKDYREFYTDRTRELVAERFARDIAHFGYTFEDGMVATPALREPPPRAPQK